MGSAIFSKFQYGVETVRGTSVAATKVLGAAPKAIPLDRQWTPIKYNTGRRSQYSHKRNDTYLVRDTLTFDADHPLYFQALPMLHQCSLQGVITPTETTGGQGDYKWTIAPSMTAANAPKTITLEMGDDVQEREVEYVMFDNLKIAGQIPNDGSAAPVTGEFSYFGRQLQKGTFTSSLSVPLALEFMNAKLARVYTNAAWGSIGTTELTGVLRGFEVEIITGNEPKFYGSANKYFDGYGEGQIGVMMTLDLEGNSVADALHDAYQAGTEYAWRLAINGSQIGTGTTYNYQVDMMGYIAEAQPLNQVIGSNNLTRVLIVAKEDLSGNFMAASITTNANTA